MKVVKLDELWRVADDRMKAAGLDTPVAQEGMRNKGGARTKGKQALLVRVKKRARAAGVEPFKAY